MEAPESRVNPNKLGKESGKRITYVVLHNAFLETVKLKTKYELLNSDDHGTIQKRAKRDPTLARPDILHQCLLTLLDSPLNKSGHLRIFIQTHKNVCIEVNKGIRIPRTFKRFAGLMVQLLHKLSIRASDGPEKLLKVIKGPMEMHFPTNARKVGFSVSSNRLVNITDWVAALPEEPVVFVIGAMSHGAIEPAYSLDDFIAISEYPLSASVCCGKLCSAFETKWGIL